MRWRARGCLCYNTQPRTLQYVPRSRADLIACRPYIQYLPKLMTPHPGVFRLAVVGSGPGGFYTAQQLIKVIDKLSYKKIILFIANTITDTMLTDITLSC